MFFGQVECIRRWERAGNSFRLDLLAVAVDVNVKPLLANVMSHRVRCLGIVVVMDYLAPALLKSVFELNEKPYRLSPDCGVCNTDPNRSGFVTGIFAIVLSRRGHI